MKDISEKLLATFAIEQREHVSRMRALLGESEAEAAGPAVIEELLRRAHTLKGAARTVGLDAVETLAHRLEGVFARVRDGALGLNENVRAVLQRALDVIEDLADPGMEHRVPAVILDVLQQLESCLAAPEPPAGPLPELAALAAPVERLETVRIRAEDLDGLLRSATQLAAESQNQTRLSRQLSQLCREMRELEQAWDRLRGPASSRQRQFEDQPEVAPLSRTVESLAHQIRSLSAQTRSALRSQQRGAWTLARLIEQLEQDTSRVRTVPAETVFDPLRRMVRELARDEAKEVEFRVTGMEVQADRLVLQALKDPVMHLLRNAVCHGIEPPPERVAAGKPAAGRIVLRVEARGDRLWVAVEDDGRGIDLKVVAEVAARRGLISDPAAAAQAPEELARLILEPGLSTARSVTRLAGRGMGLSVVHEQVRRLQGEVLLRHAAGAGTSVVLSVPLSVSRHHIVLVGCRGQTFALPMHAIERLGRLRAQDMRTVEGRPAISFQGQALPVAKLSDLVGLADLPVRGAGAGPADASPENLPAVIMCLGDQRLAVAVDKLLDERNAVVKDLGLNAAQVGKTAGGVLLEDGCVAVVLNPAELWDAFRRLEGSLGPQPATDTRRKKPAAILVVDDSITTRSLEKSILEAQGYRVRVAVDGMDALAQLRTEKSDLVIADILMPRLDGFGLLDEMKKDRELARIPVIIVSSVKRREDQERGLALGADAYIVKRKFDQRELLDAVRQLL